MPLGKSSAVNKKKSRGSQLEDRSEFIPYHSYYNAHTVITKNGELLQVIKIEGNFRGEPCENLDGIHASLCGTIRQVIAQSNLDKKVSFWLHTIRKRTPVASDLSGGDTVFPEEFSEYVSSQWKKERIWEYSYKNDVYLTILYDGQAIKLFDAKNVAVSAIPKLNDRFCNRYLDAVYPILDEFSTFILEGIRSQYKANRLTLAERVMPTSGKVARPSIFYSEFMEFLGKIVNLRSESFPLPDLDLSVAVQTTKLVFGFNAIEARNEEIGDRRFAAMLSIKQYVDMPVMAVDCVMQAPIEFIISQSFAFIPSDKALKFSTAQKKLFGMSGDIKSNVSFGIEQMLNADHGNNIDFCENQITVMVMVDDLRKLDESVGAFLDSFAKLGLVTVREEILMEECFWSQFPGNFEFIRRSAPLYTEQIGGLCRLNRYHSGITSGTHWGNYLTVLPTDVNSPYFFNFHVQDNGHTVIFDFNSFEDRTGKILQYFLLTQTRKFNTRIVVFDRNHSARLLLNKLGGRYFPMIQLENVNRDLAVDKSLRLALNPFTLPFSNYNVSFLAAWCGLLVASDVVLDEASRGVIRAAVEKLYSMPESQRNLPSLVTLIAQLNPELKEPFEKWIGQGEYAGLFDYDHDLLDMALDMVGFDMTSSISKPAFLLPLFSYLMHRVIDSIDDRPTVIVMNEAWDLLENEFFTPRLGSLLEMLRQRNVMVMFTTSKISGSSDTQTLATLMESTSTQIYMPDEMLVSYRPKNLGINAHDEYMLLGMERQKGDFLLKQSGESIALNLSIKELEDVLAIFTNDVKSLASARGRFAGVTKDY
ncbi:MAG: hypothetical protein AABY33_05045 [Pseudomonadota bacterium]